VLDDAGIVLPLPDRLTPAARVLPTAEEVAPWVEAVIRLWDDPGAHRRHQERSLSAAERWRPERIGPLHTDFFRAVRPRGSAFLRLPPAIHTSGERASRVLIYRGTENLGDAIQTVALSRLLDGDLLGVYRDEAGASVDDEVPFVVNGWLGDHVTVDDRNCLFAGVSPDPQDWELANPNRYEPDRGSVRLSC
jgi:hypothetical protein